MLTREITIDQSRSCGLNQLNNLPHVCTRMLLPQTMPPKKIKGTAKPYTTHRKPFRIRLKVFWKVTGLWLRRGWSTTSRKIISVFRRVNKTHKPFPFSDKPENTRWAQVQRFHWHKVIPFTCCLLEQRLLSDCGKIILY